ncbi:hypothetical protein [Alicyclobacillus dauci]|uniref:Uncharacterized protein n=1 Tax=Alicyclobacillus dauci TaxID=1475485 RepID=A0ABY6Z456_9BACL|nr:hypothetical protein [Alicyclobacillus dauci]WAH37673.1 hypothetical protein NZD86_03940 [Alicyclobacillus dauci]
MYKRVARWPGGPVARRTGEPENRRTGEPENRRTSELGIGYFQSVLGGS